MSVPEPWSQPDKRSSISHNGPIGSYFSIAPPQRPTIFDNHQISIPIDELHYPESLEATPGPVLVSPKPTISTEVSRSQQHKRRKSKVADRAIVDGVLGGRALSLLTKGRSFPPVGNTGAYVSRPTKKRLEEKERRNKIPRPMNSFMLYRQAYSERIKALTGRGDPQFLSRVAGSSWALETNEVKAEYAQWATLEAENHKKAYPGWKFKTKKPTNHPIVQGVCGISKKRAGTSNCNSNQPSLSPVVDQIPPNDRYFPLVPNANGHPEEAMLCKPFQSCASHLEDTQIPPNDWYIPFVPNANGHPKEPMLCTPFQSYAGYLHHMDTVVTGIEDTDAMQCMPTWLD
ncbi:hypothetical protein BJX63DRAFT_141171 [Aspergillus granulosus]|uniref:HMG box domain-containing protein n=1 Tax=Aspergillus granulosus TaxID=176169 RepID=A0ABR4GTK2_9EURO